MNTNLIFRNHHERHEEGHPLLVRICLLAIISSSVVTWPTAGWWRRWGPPLLSPDSFGRPGLFLILIVIVLILIIIITFIIILIIIIIILIIIITSPFIILIIDWHWYVGYVVSGLGTALCRQRGRQLFIVRQVIGRNQCIIFIK